MATDRQPRIRIEDLPAKEPVSEEEMAAIIGAGRRSFRPTFETLEDRTLMSASVVGISAPTFSPNNSPGILDTTAISIQHAGSGTDANIKVLIESGSTVIRTLTPASTSLAGTITETWPGPLWPMAPTTSSSSTTPGHPPGF
jgi:hypothetical protein